ncbi:ExeM/NucH family extracellular endonuclease [Nocardioides coralli]|uniref:ExeM/NucH family extracellular endonuclease n=1 Tax=Nocardioides coralli TaxID=2872154 RepID=UPI001CA3A856|nr:ExeM/NucH family extracellular endonuclease [Nocardioides coralli]QZY30403.1 ExeM/NucH family extracellular endonuclease [Nocardioides coralli]
MTSRRRAVALTAGLGLLAGAVSIGVTPAVANPAGTDLVISEVYGGGGGGTGTPSYTHDFIELYNPTEGAISLEGWSVQYKSSTGATASSEGLSGVVAPGQHFLIQSGSAGSAPGTPSLPTPDDSVGLNLSQSGGIVFLASTTTPVGSRGDVAGIGTGGLVDTVGYGTSADTYETARTGVALTNETSVARAAAGVDTDHNANDFTEGTPGPQACGDACTPPPPPTTEATIAEIQGTGEESPLDGEQVLTQGVVTAAYPTGGLNGFYLQTEGTGGELDLATHQASDGIFVYRGSSNPVTEEPGDFVEVLGTVDEYAGATQIAAFDADAVTPAAGEADPVTPVVSEWPATDVAKETLEGMLVAPQGEFTITDNYSTNLYGELVLALGDTPLVQPTQVARPHTAKAARVVADNAARRIVLDDASSRGYTSSANRGLTPAYVSNEQPFRIGATSTFDDDVILTEGGSPSSPTYRFQPLALVEGPDNATTPIVFPNTREDAPDADQVAAEGTPEMTVASFNVLNYFTTLGDADDDNVGDGGCQAYNDRAGDGNNVRTGCDQRGAWDPQDLDRQQTKIVAAINALDADVVGLMEIENSAALGEETDEALESLVAALNADTGTDTWAANPSSTELPPADQQDVITNAIIYRPAAVERVGEARALGDQSDGNGSASDEPFANAREPIAQAFAPVGGGEPVLVVVNHFKSKGSAGPFPGDADSGDGQGSSNESRVRQAEALAAWVPTVLEDVDRVLLLGDFNAYAKEDPMQLLQAEGYTNLETAAGHDEYSYSFAGQSGSLDHVLANDAALAAFTGADVWDINADEPVALEYSRWNYHGTDFHEDGPFRSSDHDPVVVGLAGAGKTTPTMEVERSPQQVYAGSTRVRLDVLLTAPEEEVTGEVRVRQGRRFVDTRALRDGAVTFRLPVFNRPGRKVVRVVYLGSDRMERVTEQVTFRVVRDR